MLEALGGMCPGEVEDLARRLHLFPGWGDADYEMNAAPGGGMTGIRWTSSK